MHSALVKVEIDGIDITDKVIIKGKTLSIPVSSDWRQLKSRNLVNRLAAMAIIRGALNS